MWTGAEMIVWGGWGDENGTVKFADGAAYNPVSGEWRMIAPAPLEPRWNHLVAWIDEGMLILGPGRSGAVYSAVTDTWTPMPDSPIAIQGEPISAVTSGVWTGEEYVVWNAPADQVAAYDPNTETWRILEPTGLDVANGVVRFNGSNLFAFGTEPYGSSAVPLLAVMQSGDGWTRLPDAELWTDEYAIGANPKLTAWFDNRWVVWTDSPREGKTLELLPPYTEWTAATPIDIPGCEGATEPVPLTGATLAFSGCGVDAVVEHTDGSSTEVHIVAYAGARDTVWTGTQVLSWGDTCCYGTGSSAPFTVDAWSLTLDG